MGIEGGGRWESPERGPSNKELGLIFVGQNQDNETVLEPQPKNLMELRAIHPHTFNLVLTAHYFLMLLDQYHKDIQVALMGGLGVASVTSRDGLVYRTSHDIDVLLPDDQIDQVLDLAYGDKRISSNFRRMPLARNIYRLEVPAGLGFADPSLITNLARKKVLIDLFIYNRLLGYNAYFDGGSYPGLDLGVRFPIEPENRKLMGLPIKTAPREVLMRMKRYDANVRNKGRLDYQRLQVTS